MNTDKRISTRADAVLPWIRFSKGIRRHAGTATHGQKGFTLVELGTVLIIATMLIGTTTVVYYQTTRKTDLKTAAELVKEDLRKVYALTDSGGGVTDGTGMKHRDQYRIQFHTNDGAHAPVNSYRILKRTWDIATGSYSAWEPVEPERSSAVKVLSDSWVRPTMSSDTQITALTNMSGADGEKGITFEAKGSIIQTDPPLGDKTITLGTAGSGDTITITVSMYGSVE
ncbi:MAG: hypothetical protein JXA49_04575 [Actinobacteria bacterium]|nr:hypothetical protein [Actinomycetota bacterium]